MLDHVFLTVSNLNRSIAFYEAARAPLGITQRVDYDGQDGPPGHPDLKGRYSLAVQPSNLVFSRRDRRVIYGTA